MVRIQLFAQPCVKCKVMSESLPSRSLSFKGQNTSNTHNSEGVEIQWLIYHWWEHNVGAGTLQKDLTVQKLNTQLPHDPEIPLLAICPR